jgi:hypothetical protein
MHRLPNYHCRILKISLWFDVVLDIGLRCSEVGVNFIAKIEFWVLHAKITVQLPEALKNAWKEYDMKVALCF